MGLAADLDDLAPVVTGCKTCHLLGTLPEPDRSALAAAVEDESRTAAAIARLLRAHGHDVSERSVRAHRRGHN